ncbi:CHAD domain-containing protein [Haloferula chungangensis]|uniref:CHAD domain-containing protein n=1 Tax=Haloferula chungangensis TaxID=1048331 RepID=A0ABW2L7U7_9BACT
MTVATNPKPQRWDCSKANRVTLAGLLGDDYQLDHSAPSTRTLELYDSFDRPFSKNGQSLVRLGGIFSIIDDDQLSNPTTSSKQKIKHHRPVFWWDFEDGDFQSVLRSQLKLRAALPLAKADLEESLFRVRNADRKIVLRLSLHTILDSGEILAQTLTAHPLVGYEDEANDIAQRLSNSPDLSADTNGLLACVRELVDAPSALPSSKAQISLHPNESLQKAVTRIARTMLETARHSEPGIIDDIDTEFLHDYRVAIRKLRSVVTLVKGAYPAEERRRLKSEFGDHARATNRLRDLDVYLLQEDQYRNLVPENLRSGLDRMFDDFRRDRGREITTVRRRLRSKSYLKAMQQRTDWLNAEDLPAGARADQEIGSVVTREILKHYRHVRKLGMALTDSTPDEQVHELRIECKRLRYLLELFASLFDQKGLRKILRRLKGLQNVLGDFNDFSMQSIAMEDYLHKAPKLDKHTSAALGALIAVLYNEQLKARASVAERFSQFSDGKMRKRFQTLFSNLQSPEP